MAGTKTRWKQRWAQGSTVVAVAAALIAALASAPAAARPGYGPGGGHFRGPGIGHHHPGSWVRPYPGFGYRGPGRGYRGGWVGGLPLVATVVTIGGLSYWYADGLYYRAVPAGGYEVVTPQADTAADSAPDRFYVYPRQGQGAEQQASDEYECHRWAVTQSGFDPTAAATGGSIDISRKNDYGRAQAACLDGRGYTVK